MRNTIEGLNGLVKDPAHEALAQPARRRVRGIAAQSIFTALLLMAANIRKIRAWRTLTARSVRHAPNQPAPNSAPLARPDRHQRHRQTPAQY